MQTAQGCQRMNSVKAQEERAGMSRKEGGPPCCCAPIGCPFLQTPVPPVLLLWATKLQRVGDQFISDYTTLGDIHSLCLSLSLSLSQLYAKLQCIKAEIQDVNDEHVRSRQELEQTQNELTRELKFKWVETVSRISKYAWIVQQTQCAFTSDTYAQFHYWKQCWGIWDVKIMYKIWKLYRHTHTTSKWILATFYLISIYNNSTMEMKNDHHHLQQHSDQKQSCV